MENNKLTRSRPDSTTKYYSKLKANHINKNWSKYNAVKPTRGTLIFFLDELNKFKKVKNGFIVSSGATVSKIQIWCHQLFSDEESAILIELGKYKLYPGSNIIEFPDGTKLKY